MKHFVAAIVLVTLSAGSVWAQPCRDEVGVTEAQVLVDQCRMSSLATHPPCNADNTCSVIVEHIKLSCETLSKKESADGTPSFCAPYLTAASR